MGTQQFTEHAKRAVFDWLCNRYAQENVTIAIDWQDVQIVWQCKTLQNHKAILIALTPDQYLFEATYNGDKQEMYLDVYDKVQNQRLDMRGEA